jgi:hypothetical protein
MPKIHARTYHVVDEGALHKYRTEIPNTVIRGLHSRGLSLPARWMYVYLKSVAGDQGECWQNTTTLASGAQLSRGAVSLAKKELIKVGLIALLSKGKQYHDTDKIRILDIWDDNWQEFRSVGCSSGEQPPQEVTPTESSNYEEVVHQVNNQAAFGCSPHELGCSPHELEEDPYLKKIPKKERSTPVSPHGAIQPKTTPTPPSPTTAYSPGFLRFWRGYPQKKRKGAAWKVWQKLHLDALADDICASVADHLRQDAAWHNGYVQYPATYLADRCWEDEFPTAPLSTPHPERLVL